VNLRWHEDADGNRVYDTPSGPVTRLQGVRLDRRAVDPRWATWRIPDGRHFPTLREARRALHEAARPPTVR
jgi:hypothetical protein